MLYNILNDRFDFFIRKVKVLIMVFTLGSVAPEQDAAIPFLFLFQQNNLLVKKQDIGYTIPDLNDLSYLESELSGKLYIGSLDGHSCYTSRYPEDRVLPDGMELLGLRQLHEQIDSSILQAAFRAVQIVVWDETHRFCGVCGKATVKKTDEHAKVCFECGQIFYPRISPAVIVAITRGDRLLLARNKNFVPGLYSVLAGFVEVGENLEECVKREIREEVGIEVKNIKYFGSQPWPFPNSLMLAFTAEYESGEIRPDGSEIAEAGWFSVEEIPKIPGKLSVSRKLIDWFIEKYQR